MDGKGFLKSRVGSHPAVGVPEIKGSHPAGEIKGSHPARFPSGSGRHDGWERVLEIKDFLLAVSHPAPIEVMDGKGFLNSRVPIRRGSHPAALEVMDEKDS